MSNDKIVLLILIQRESNCVTKLFRKMKFIKNKVSTLWSKRYKKNFLITQSVEKKSSQRSRRRRGKFSIVQRVIMRHKAKSIKKSHLSWKRLEREIHTFSSNDQRRRHLFSRAMSIIRTTLKWFFFRVIRRKSLSLTLDIHFILFSAWLFSFLFCFIDVRLICRCFFVWRQKQGDRDCMWSWD